MAFLRPWAVVIFSFFLLYMAWTHQANLGVAATAKKLLGVMRIVQRSPPVAGDQRKAFNRHIVAVGDLHGDFGSAKSVLKFAHVTDEHDKWSGQVDFFVQTGDLIDRGIDTIELLKFMNKLHDEAAEAGGTVLLHMGNHEWMNAIGDWRYVDHSEIQSFGSIEARQHAFSSDGWIGQSWKKDYRFASRLPLHLAAGSLTAPYSPPGNPPADHHHNPLSHAAISFVHGGLPPRFSKLVPFPTLINTLGSSALAKLGYQNLTADELEVVDYDGPLWYRGWARLPTNVVCDEVHKVLEQTGTRRMVMGHTIHLKGIESRCGGKILIIDTGISHVYGGRLSALDIHYSLTPVPGAKEKWMEKEVIHAVYGGSRQLITEDVREIVGHF